MNEIKIYLNKSYSSSSFPFGSVRSVHVHSVDKNLRQKLILQYFFGKTTDQLKSFNNKDSLSNVENELPARSNISAGNFQLFCWEFSASEICKYILLHEYIPGIFLFDLILSLYKFTGHLGYLEEEQAMNVAEQNNSILWFKLCF